MKPAFLFKPITNIYIRIIFLILAIVIFSWSGMYMGEWFTSGFKSDAWKLAVPGFVIGTILLLKSFDSGKPESQNKE